LLPNKNGTAPGLYYSENNKHFFALPGVPAEMRSIFLSHVIPILQKNITCHPIYQKTIRTIGIPESILFTQTKSVRETSETNIAFLPKSGLVDIRVYGTSEQEVENIINKFLKIIPSQNIYGFDEESIEGKFHKIMMSSGKTLSAAESCTGGLIANRLTDISGSSEYFKQGIICYSNSSKIEQLGVSEKTILAHGAVSRETALEMARNIRQIAKTDIGLSTTGIAGPTGGSPEKPLGTVYIGLSMNNREDVFHFQYNRLHVWPLILPSL